MRRGIHKDFLAPRFSPLTSSLTTFLAETPDRRALIDTFGFQRALLATWGLRESAAKSSIETFITDAIYSPSLQSPILILLLRTRVLSKYQGSHFGLKG